MVKDAIFDISFALYEHHLYKGSENYRAKLVALKRKSIYGERKVIALDKDGNECNRVFYDEKDMTLYPKKATGICKITGDGKMYTEKSGDKEVQRNSVMDKVDYAGIVHLKVSQVDPNCSVYKMEEEAENIFVLEEYDSKVIAQFIGDKIFSAYNCKIFQRNGTAFLVLNKCESVSRGDFAEKNMGYQIDDQPLVSDITELDDIDFAMF